MRVFWALMAVLVIATAVLVAGRGGGGDGPARATSLSERAAEPEPEAARSEPGAMPEVTEDAAEAVAVEPEPAPEIETPTAEVAGADEPEATPEPVTEAEAPDEDPVVTAEADDAGADDDEGEAYTLKLNDRWGITGSGTAADPYAIDFDMLVALEQDYAPTKDNEPEIPEWIKPLDDKQVIITGFIGFPFIAPTSDECMVMLNQWDGCCIGIPPTPYDAVEVQLAEPVDLSAGVPNYGTITGTFRTDPYLINGWLMGVYVMEDARLIDTGSRNQAGF